MLRIEVRKAGWMKETVLKSLTVYPNAESFLLDGKGRR